MKRELLIWLEILKRKTKRIDWWILNLRSYKGLLSLGSLSLCHCNHLSSQWIEKTLWGNHCIIPNLNLILSELRNQWRLIKLEFLIMIWKVRSSQRKMYSRVLFKNLQRLIEILLMCIQNFMLENKVSLKLKWRILCNKHSQSHLWNYQTILTQLWNK